MKRAKNFSEFCLTLLTVFALASPVAFAREPVDPTTLNPPPPPNFNPVCESVGNGTICDIQFSEPFAAGSEVTCGSGSNTFEPFQSQTRSVRSKRYYDQNGNLVRTHYHEYIDGTLVNPITGKALTYSGTLNHLDEEAVPGDVSTVTQAITGSVRIFLGQGNGTLAFDTGRLVDSPEGILQESGQHPFFDYFVLGDTAALQPLCDALQ
jgi:hypothetical protein